MEINLLVVSAIVVGLAQIFKELRLDKRYTVVFTLIVGIAIVAIAAPLIKIDGWRSVLINGLIVGLQAMGLYSGGKALMEKNR